MPCFRDPASLCWIHYFLLAAILCSLILASFIAHWLIQAQEGLALRTQTQSDAAQIAQRLNSEIARQINPIRKLKYRWQQTTLPADPELADAATAQLPLWPPFLFIGGINSSGECTWFRPGISTDYATWEPAFQDSHWPQLLAEARSSAFEAATTFIDRRTRQPTLDIVIPLFSKSTEPDAPSDGATVCARLSLAPAINMTIGDHIRREYNCELSSKDCLLFSVGSRHSNGEGYGDTQLVHVVNIALRLQLWPSDLTIATRINQLGKLVLFSGICASFLFTAALWQILRHRLRSSHQLRAYLTALESLNELSTAISAKLGSGREVLDQLAALARQLLGMSAAGIILVDRDTEALCLCAASGNIPSDVPTCFNSDATLASARCIQTGQLFFIGDTAHSPLPLNQSVMGIFGIRSLILIPLTIEGSGIGMMVVANSLPRRFSDADRRLARLLGSQASVILANNRLYEQTRSILNEQKTLREQQEHLYAVNAAVYQAPTFAGSLRAITELVPAALGVDMCVVNLIDDNNREMTVVAATGQSAAAIIGKRFTIANTNAERVFQTRQMLVIENAPADFSLHPDFRDAFRVGAIIYAPLLRSDHQPLGILVLICHTPGLFTDAQRNLAQVFTSRAAAAIENALLHEQTRRDAQTKAILLRELHHRVKNNLAGIVGLLSINQPDLAPATRQWLDRAIERIQIMAKTHDLFTSGLDHVDLRQLVEQILPSLSVIRPPGVVIHNQVPDDGSLFTTPQAVSLAIAIHELCTNAIQHGMDGQGTLTVEAHNTPNGIAIDVIDDGRGLPPELLDPQPLSTNHERGLGLQLVRELVGRELHGSLRLRPRPGGGTIASIELPLPRQTIGCTP
jgi:two-component sensor histidine kinase